MSSSRATAVVMLSSVAEGNGQVAQAQLTSNPAQALSSCLRMFNTLFASNSRNLLQ